MPFTSFKKLDIPDLILIEPRVFEDDRGFFKETYKQSDFAANSIPDTFVQDNLSWSAKGVIRGLHYQRNPKPMGKLVTVFFGEIFDVAVDLRFGSPTFGQWVGVTLSAANHMLLYVPAGFAHGFACLTDQALVSYKVTSEFNPDLDTGIRWDDPTINVRWPLEHPLLSPKDRTLPTLDLSQPNLYF